MSNAPNVQELGTVNPATAPGKYVAPDTEMSTEQNEIAPFALALGYVSFAGVQARTDPEWQ